MSATSYYATKQRVGARTERIRTEIDRSSAYILDSGNVTSSYTSPSYSSSTLGRQSSFRDESSRVGRTRARDSSIDCTTRIRHRSGSMDFSAPVKMRTRDHSVDYSSYSKPTYTANNRAPRPVTTNYDNDDDEHSPEYKKIMGQTDVTLTMSKYAKKDGDSLKVDGMIEEERRSKAYSKIIGQSSAQQLEKDAYRSTMCDLFADTKSFSAKTMQAINKECLYKEDKGPKNYGWRKDMESYEENLEVQEKHKRAVRESTRATNDVQPRYKDLNAKLRDYDRECRRNVDSEEPVRKVTVTISTPTLDRKSYKAPEPVVPSYNGTSHTNGTTSYSNGTSSYSNGTSSYKSNREEEDTTASAPKRGSWRKDIEAYEEKLTKNKPTPVINRNIETKEEPKETPKVYSWQKSSATTSTTSTSSASSVKSSATTTTNYSSKTEPVKQTPTPAKIEEPKVNSAPTWKKPEPTKVEEPKPVETKPTPTWKKPDPPKVEAKPVETPVVKKVGEETPKWKKPETKVEEAKPPAAAAKKEEVKPETPKATPKWKKPETTVKPAEEKPAETPKATPKWKKSEPAAKKEEPKPAEEAKPAPKWKKPGTAAAKKEEEKPVEEAKPAPKWKKPETAAKKEEPKPVEEAKPAPKWKKAEPAKKEEPKPAEEAKPTPKWKKPETAKKEEPKPVEEAKPTPKWKKPATAKKEEPKPAEEAKPAPKWKKAEAKKEETKTEVKEEEPIAVAPVEEVKPAAEEENRLKPEVESTQSESAEKKEGEGEKKEGEGEKKEGEEEEDHYGMKAMAKEEQTKFSAMDEEFAAGASKLSALRQKMKALRMKHKAAAEADAAAEAARQG